MQYSFCASNARAGNALAYETRVGSPPDFQLKRVSALKELEIPMISSSVKALVQYSFCASNARATLQTRETHLTFGGYKTTQRSKREKLTSHLEGIRLHNPPNAGNSPHIWSVSYGMALAQRFGDFMEHLPENFRQM